MADNSCRLLCWNFKLHEREHFDSKQREISRTVHECYGYFVFSPVGHRNCTGILFSHLSGTETALDISFSHLSGTETALDISFSCLSGTETALDISFSHLSGTETTLDISFSHVPGTETAAHYNFSASNRIFLTLTDTIIIWVNVGELSSLWTDITMQFGGFYWNVEW